MNRSIVLPVLIAVFVGTAFSPAWANDNLNTTVNPNKLSAPASNMRATRYRFAAADESALHQEQTGLL